VRDVVVLALLTAVIATAGTYIVDGMPALWPVVSVGAVAALVLAAGSFGLTGGVPLPGMRRSAS